MPARPGKDAGRKTGGTPFPARGRGRAVIGARRFRWNVARGPTSLRGRLTLGVVLVLAVVLATAGVLLSRYVESSEREVLDERLQRTAQLSQATALDAIQEGLPERDRRLDAALEATRTSLRLLVGSTVLL